MNNNKLKETRKENLKSFTTISLIMFYLIAMYVTGSNYGIIGLGFVVLVINIIGNRYTKIKWIASISKFSIPIYYIIMLYITSFHYLIFIFGTIMLVINIFNEEINNKEN
jgi:hypothetical protein